MNIGKTNYKFQVSASDELVKKVIEQWLKDNKFKFQNKYGEDIYYYHDAWNGNRGFQYTVNNNEVNVYAWTIAVGGKFYMLDSGAINNMAGDSYKRLLTQLFDRINNISTSDVSMVEGNPNQDTSQVLNNQAQASTQNISQVSNNLNNETIKKTEKMCEIGFWLSIVGLILPFLGITFGLIVYILIIVFAVRGLDTSKKAKAITSIILASFSSFIVIINTILGMI